MTLFLEPIFLEKQYIMKSIPVKLPEKRGADMHNLSTRLCNDEYQDFSRFCMENSVSQAAMIRTLIRGLISNQYSK